MKKCALIVCLFSSTAFAIPPGQWQCFAFDDAEHRYEAFGKNPKQAMKEAAGLCRHYSKASRTCQTAQSYCEQGPLSLIEDRCVVSDDIGRSWNTTGYNACKTAMELCQKWQFLHGIQRQCTVKHS